jgi:hypothetical protein
MNARIHSVLILVVGFALCGLLAAQSNEELQKQLDHLKTAMREQIDRLEKEAKPTTNQEAPKNLDEMIATALKANPDVLLAEAKLREAQAELNQVRLKVTREVVTAFEKRKQGSVSLRRAKENLDRMQKEIANGTSSAGASDLDAQRMAYGQVELGMAHTDADLRYLLGVGSAIDPASLAPHDPKPNVAPHPRPAAPPAITEALARTVRGPFGATLKDLVDQLGQQAKVSILIDAQNFPDPGEHPVLLPLRDPVTLGAALQALADQQDACFVLRDYGIFLTSEGKARNMMAATIPEHLPMDEDAR